MALYLVLLSTILAFSLASTEQYVPSLGSNIHLSLDSMKNASGHSITKVDTMKENPRPLSVNVQQEISNETDQLAHPSLHDSSMSGAVQPTTPESCPQSGYQLYEGFNCYKVFPSNGERKNWTEAREQCVRDGGDLIVIESERERKDVFIPLYNSARWNELPWVGVYIPQSGNDWISVKGEPVPSSWWYPGEPEKIAAYKCAFAIENGLLWNDNGIAPRNFICEIAL